MSFKKDSIYVSCRWSWSRIKMRRWLILQIWWDSWGRRRRRFSIRGGRLWSGRGGGGWRRGMKGWRRFRWSRGGRIIVSTRSRRRSTCYAWNGAPATPPLTSTNSTPASPATPPGPSPSTASPTTPPASTKTSKSNPSNKDGRNGGEKSLSSTQRLKAKSSTLI